MLNFPGGVLRDPTEVRNSIGPSSWTLVPGRATLVGGDVEALASRRMIHCVPESQESIARGCS